MTEIRLGLVVTTVGRPQLRRLLLSAAAASHPPDVVAVANQSGRPLGLDLPDLPFEVREIASSGGASRGRNEAFELVASETDVVGLPNDDTWYEPGALAAVRALFRETPAPDAVAASLVDGGRPRLTLPADGTPLDRRTVWRAIEPGLFLRSAVFKELQGFREDLGTGGPSPWQSGEGTDLLLRLLADGGRVVSAPSVRALCDGERRDLTRSEWVLKHRRYARGTGYVYRVHEYPLRRRLTIVAAPWMRAVAARGPLGERFLVARARSLGRVEGLLDRPLRTVASPHRAR
ncbi:glycosyltransferase family 2 protein [Pseudofrankia saprophytica]|uniref:glycosyltransferase family 2 protein n=1 Tax=Pseudofrankia saprophytica TaxID=298655 RepID=UPI000234D843|nr:hypothetical protein [Pseudofrankia saprophytica]